jgi:hypothetical protein
MPMQITKPDLLNGHYQADRPVPESFLKVAVAMLLLSLSLIRVIAAQSASSTGAANKVTHKAM